MADTDQDTIYQLLEIGADFDGEGFEVRLERPAYSPGSRGTLRRLVFVDVDVDPTEVASDLTVETVVDGDEDTRKSKEISTRGSGSLLRKKVSWRRAGRWFNLAYRFSSGTGAIDSLVDANGDNVADSAGNLLTGKGEAVRRFRLLGHTFGVQSLGSRRR